MFKKVLFILFFVFSFSNCFAKNQSELQNILLEAINQSKEKFPNFIAKDISITLIDITNKNIPIKAEYQGEQEFYPASILKLFLLVMLEDKILQNKINENEQIKYALNKMISISSNDATSYIIDLLTNTTSGPELSNKKLKEFLYKRNSINRYFKNKGYNIQIWNKPAYEGKYGRENQIPYSSKITTNDTAKLLYEIFTDKILDQKTNSNIKNLLKRDINSAKESINEENTNYQALMFSAKYLPKDSEYYSKAGWTTKVRHDASYIILPNNKKYIFVIFTANQSENLELIPFISKIIADNLY